MGQNYNRVEIGLDLYGGALVQRGFNLFRYINYDASISWKEICFILNNAFSVSCFVMPGFVIYFDPNLRQVGNIGSFVAAAFY